MWAGIWDLLLSEPFHFRKTTTKVLDLETLQKFFANILFAGNIGINNMKQLWNKKPFEISWPHKKKILSQDKFFQLTSNMQFKLKDIFNRLLTNFTSHILPSSNLCIDEIRIPVRHYKCDSKKYNIKKPDVWAVESKSLHDENGYLIKMSWPLHESDGKSVVDSLDNFFDYIKHTGITHVTCMDSNFISATDVPTYTSKTSKIIAMCSQNRPSWLFKKGLVKNLPRSYTRVAKHEDMIAACTYNNGFCNLVTNYFLLKDMDTKSSSDERRVVLNYYDQQKGKADKFGQLYKNYNMMVKVKNWELAVLLGWFKYACTNAFIIHKSMYGSLKHQQFLYEIGVSLVN